MSHAIERFPSSTTSRALFRAAAERPSATAALPLVMRLHWPQLVGAILALSEARSEDAAPHLRLAQQMSVMGARPQDYFAMHGAFEGVLARIGGDTAQREAWEGLIDAVLSAMLKTAYGLRARPATPMAA